MVKLTIKGNKTRGKEVIEILKHILMIFFKKPSAKVDEVYITETKVCTIFEYKLTNGTASINRKQCEIFSSKEELLKSL